MEMTCSTLHYFKEPANELHDADDKQLRGNWGRPMPRRQIAHSAKQSCDSVHPGPPRPTIAGDASVVNVRDMVRDNWKARKFSQAGLFLRLWLRGYQTPTTCRDGWFAHMKNGDPNKLMVIEKFHVRPTHFPTEI